MEQIHLSRRNLVALLNKLDHRAAGQPSTCTLVKYKQTDGTPFNQTMDAIAVTAVEDNVYYPAQERPPGAIITVYNTDKEN